VNSKLVSGDIRRVIERAAHCNVRISSTRYGYKRARNVAHAR